MLATVATVAGVPLGLGLVLGALVAVVGLFIAPDPPAMSDLVARGYWLLAGLLPLALGLGIYTTQDQPEHAAAYRSPVRAAATALQAAILGAGLGGGPFYLLSATYAPVILLGYDVASWSVELRSRIFWAPWLWVVGISVVVALPLAYWAYRSAEA